jgi:hypothetical protein
VTSRTEDTKKASAGDQDHDHDQDQDLMRDLHGDRLAQEFQKLVAAVGARAATSLLGKVDAVTDRLTDYTETGGPGLLSAVTGGNGPSAPARGALAAFAKTKLRQGLRKAGIGGDDGPGGDDGSGGDGGDGKGKKLKVTNIVETLDIGAPVRLVYNQWTQFEDFPSFTKKVENVEQESDERLSWRAQVFWSHRTWESTILEQIPDKRIVWRSKGAKGYVDGAVTFHELAPDLTRITLVLEYHPQGFFEHTGNLWRAQGRRARLEFKHFGRHLISQAILHADEIEGWRGEIRDGEVVKDHEPASGDEDHEDYADQEDEEDDQGRDDYEDDYEDEDEDIEEEDQQIKGGEDDHGRTAGRRRGNGPPHGRRTRRRDRHDSR